VYGPGQNPHGEAGVVAIFLKKMLEGDQPVINGTGLQTRDYVFIDDVVNANVLALSSTASGAVNISTNVETNVLEIVNFLRTASGMDCPAVHGPAKSGEPMRGCYNNALAKQMLGWEPRVAMNDGIARTVAWELQHRRL
jgi:UDP-glucose 4-epimerase